MFGLILKDLKNVKGQIVYYIVVFVALAGISIATGNVYFMSGVSFLGVALPLSAIAIDEKDKWDTFALAAGVTRSRLVLSRYILACVSFGLMLAAAFSVAAASRLLDNAAVVAVYLAFIAAGVLLGASVSVLIELVEGAKNILLFLPMALGVAGLLPSMYASLRIYQSKNF